MVKAVAHKMSHSKVFSLIPFKSRERRIVISTRMHSSRMPTTRSSGRPGVLHQAAPREQISPDQAPPWDQAPPGADTSPGAGVPRDQAR